MKRLIQITSFLALCATPAAAGDSVLNITSTSTGAGSILTLDCDKCPPLKVKDTGPKVHGVEVIEKHIGGEKKIVQTDNLMGGTAVRYVKSSFGTDNTAGESVTHTSAGTTVASGNEGTINFNGELEPVTADVSNRTTYSGGGEFSIERVSPDGSVSDGVDGGSRTSSVSEGGGAEIIELRPTH